MDIKSSTTSESCSGASFSLLHLRISFLSFRLDVEMSGIAVMISFLEQTAIPYVVMILYFIVKNSFHLLFYSLSL